MSAEKTPFTKPPVPFSRPGTPKLFTPQVGFIGLGNMGYFMARNFALGAPQAMQDLPPLLVWNRTPEKSQKLADTAGTNKVRIAESPEQIAKECDVIFVNLANDEVVRSVYHRLVSSMQQFPPTRNKIYVETSTLYPSIAAELDSSISSFAHAHFITCPIIGTPLVADNSQLLLVMSGDYRSKKEVAHLLVPSVGRKVIDLGEDPQKALTFKLIANSLILGNLEILAETFTFAEKTGIGSENVNDFLSEYFPAASTMNYANRMLQDNFDGQSGFSIDGGIKDATHMRRLTAEHNSPMPTVDCAYRNLLTARALHTRLKKEGTPTWSVLDWSSLVAGTRVAAGLEGFDRTKDANVASQAEDNT